MTVKESAVASIKEIREALTPAFIIGLTSVQRQCVLASLDEMIVRIRRTVDRIKSEGVRAALNNDIALARETIAAINQGAL